MKKNFEYLAIVGACLAAQAALPPPASIAAEDQIALGKKVFTRSTCEGCHPNGSNLINPGRPIKGEKFARRYKDDYVLEQVIRHGFPSVGMPKFPKHVINDKEMKALIVYIRTFTPKSDK